MANPSVTSFGDATMSAALSLFSSVLSIVAIDASVKPIPFKQVSRASGCFNSAESDVFCGTKRVRTGVML